MKADPPFTGKCPVCGSAVETLRIHGRYETDPFDRSVCAKAWHGVDFTDARSVSVEHAIPAGSARDPMLRS